VGTFVTSSDSHHEPGAGYTGQAQHFQPPTKVGHLAGNNKLYPLPFRELYTTIRDNI